MVEYGSFALAMTKDCADLLPKGRQPASFLGLKPGPGEVDVNVHPAKSAVRLRGGRSAHPLVVGAITGAFLLEKEEKGGVAPQSEGDGQLKLIEQFAGRCILAEVDEKLIILAAQHGAHERTLY